MMLCWAGHARRPLAAAIPLTLAWLKRSADATAEDQAFVPKGDNCDDDFGVSGGADSCNASGPNKQNE